MKKFLALVFAFTMLLSVVFISGAISNSNPFSVQAQTGQVTVRKRRPGIARTTYHGGRWVVRKTWNGTKWVYRKVWVATKWTGKKTWKTSRKVVSRTKKIVY